MTHIRTKTPNGDDIVIMPAAEYDRLIEAAEDLRDSEIVERSRREIANGEVELLTSTEMKELLAAKTPLAFWRKKRGLTQAAVAKETGVAQGFLSEIEAGQKPGTTATLKKIADVLRIAIDDLI
jgi:DNA-binding XRE family transcriptional regulator